MKSLKVLFFVALFTPWISRAEASPMKFQETVLVAGTQQLSGVDTFSEETVFSPLTINENSITNQGHTFLIAQAKRFPGAAITSGGRPIFVPGAVNVKRNTGNTGVRQVIVSPTVLQNVTSAGDVFILNFTKNTLFNNPFTSSDLGQIAVDTTNILAANFEVTTDPITLTFGGTTTSYETLAEANAAVFEIISTTGLNDGPVLLDVFGVKIGYGIAP
ncbi:MAG: hypothetical protein VKL41_19670 [Snowella sp.]|nr:hypothetical protein [Snowella sp.]